MSTFELCLSDSELFRCKNEASIHIRPWWRRPFHFADTLSDRLLKQERPIDLVFSIFHQSDQSFRPQIANNGLFIGFIVLIFHSNSNSLLFILYIYNSNYIHQWKYIHKNIKLNLFFQKLGPYFASPTTYIQYNT